MYRREELISVLEKVIQQKLDKMCTEDADLPFDCFLPENAANLMAKQAVSVFDAFHAAEDCLRLNGITK